MCIECMWHLVRTNHYFVCHEAKNGGILRQMPTTSVHSFFLYFSCFVSCNLLFIGPFFPQPTDRPNRAPLKPTEHFFHLLESAAFTHTLECSSREASGMLIPSKVKVKAVIIVNGWIEKHRTELLSRC